MWIIKADGKWNMGNKNKDFRKQFKQESTENKDIMLLSVVAWPKMHLLSSLCKKKLWLSLLFTGKLKHIYASPYWTECSSRWNKNGGHVVSLSRLLRIKMEPILQKTKKWCLVFKKCFSKSLALKISKIDFFTFNFIKRINS